MYFVTVTFLSSKNDSPTCHYEINSNAAADAKGLELYSLVDQMTAHPEACHSLFVPGKIEKVTSPQLLY